MTKFEGCYLTNDGLKMVHDAGLGNITFTKAVTGSGIYESKEDIPEMTALKQQKQEFGLDGIILGENYTVDVKFKIRNEGLAEEYNLSEIGIYAKGDDGEEKLYCVAFALPGSAEPVPADEGGIAYITSIDIETVVSTDANVSIIYSEDHEWTKEYVDGVVKVINKSKADKSVKASVTIPTSGWSGEAAPYSNTISVTGVTADNNVELVLPEDVTAEQIEGYQTAQILNAAQSEGRLTLYAWGEIPSVDLPMTVIVRGD